MRVEYKYIGVGAWVADLPTRDITEQDLLDHPDWRVIIDANLGNPTSCYERVEQPKRAVKEIKPDA